MTPKVLPSIAGSPTVVIHGSLPPTLRPDEPDYIAWLPELRASIVSAADKGFREIDVKSREAIEELINLATRNDTTGTEAQKVLQEIYAHPPCASIRDNLQRAAYNMCKIAHVAGDWAPLSITVVCLGATVAQGDVKHFLNTYLNVRLNNPAGTDVLDVNAGCSHPAKMDDTQASSLVIQMENLDRSVTATDAELAKSTAQLLSPAHALSVASPALLEPATTAAVSNSPAASAAAPGAAFARIKSFGERLSIGTNQRPGSAAFNSAFSDLASYREVQHDATKTDYERRFNQFMPKVNSPSVPFNSAVQLLESTISSNKLLKVKQVDNNPANSAIYTTMQNSARPDSIQLLALRPAVFLKHCEAVAVAHRSNDKNLQNKATQKLKEEAIQFIADQKLMVANIDKDLKQLFEINNDNKADELFQALKSVRDDCLEGFLYKDVLAFAMEVKASPDAAFKYFDSLSKSPSSL